MAATTRVLLPEECVHISWWVASPVSGMGDAHAACVLHILKVEGVSSLVLLLR